MLLNYKTQGTGEAVILMHGLFGALDNLGTLARHLSSDCQVISVDLTNHGKSKHTQHTTYQAMAADVIELLDALNITKFTLVGHSMGGKVAMEIALSYPERVQALVVADIAPVAYTDRHYQVFDALNSVDLVNLANRQQAQQQLVAAGIDIGTSGFLLKNLIKTDQGFGWRCNVAGLQQAYPQIIAGLPTDGQYHGPTLFIKGELSDYIVPSHRAEIGRYFPQAKAKIIQGTGHWLHAEKPAAFNKIVSNFINLNS